MVKGTSRRIIVVKSPDPEVFDEAIFVVKEEFLRSPGVSQTQLLSDARRAAAGLVEKSGKSTAGRLPQSLAISVSAILGSGIAVAVMKIFGL